MSSRSSAIVNAGGSAWAFSEYADHLSRLLGAPVSAEATAYNYLLAWDQPGPPSGRTFISYEAIRVAGDQREMAAAFAAAGGATPLTHLCDEAELRRLAADTDRRWVVKWPTGCGAVGHWLLSSNSVVPPDWPRPFVVQEFVAMPEPEVYRLYCVAGEAFGWNVRRFPKGVPSSPWVAHARGARYEECGAVPEAARIEAVRALSATDLLASFGCVDLLRNAAGEWLVLEVNTDGVAAVVDRDIGIRGIREELDERLSQAFHAWTSAGHE